MREYKGKSQISLPSDYIVIDTETTGLDYEYCNIIEISAIRYSEGKAIDKFSTLVKPPLCKTYYPLRNGGEGEWQEYYVDSFVTELTGITNEMLEAAPMPSEVLPAFLNYVGDSVLIGHNVHFDINFLYDAVEKECGSHFANDFIDTLRIARKLFPELAHHRLSDIASACDIDQPKAHRAEADCIVTAQCFEYMKEKILATQSETDFQDLFKKKSNYSTSLSSVSATVDSIDDTNPIYGKVVVFTGALSSMSRKEAFQIVVNLGGNPEDSITKKTNYLVIGNGEFAQSVKDGKTKKMQKAEAYQKKGAEISVISENAFFDLISDYQ